MPRVISFIVLLAIVLLVGAVFFQVMAEFIVPLFLAAVLMVVFQPLHAWTRTRMPGYPRTAALITTMLILLAVLLPLTWLGWRAYVDFYALLSPPTASQPAGGRVVYPQRAKPPTATNQQKEKEEENQLAAKLTKTANDLRHRFEEFTKIQLKEDEVPRLIDRATSQVGAWLLSAVQSAIGILIGLAIMVLSLYYFLADGPAMVRAVMHLSPLEEEYEQELLERFGSISRAVVVATLLSAAVQGALAGIGYYFALPKQAPLFLLTALTMVTAMVPFVGAAFMWICVCAWIYLYGERVVDGQVMHDGNPTTAILLAIYCTFFVSLSDNLIKPWVLHGQSKLHPLLALLSILGGVQVLGPVGILVGPMLVSFLQALLNMLRKELDSFGGVEPKQLAAIVDATSSIESKNDVPAAADAKSTKAASPASKPPESRQSKRKGRR